MTQYDGIIIGAGPGGYEAAFYAARLGKKIAIVERYRLGGTCLHWGCIPTKTLIASAKNYLSIRNATLYGLQYITEHGVDWSEIYKHHRKIVENLTIGLEKTIKSKGIDIFYGHGSLIDEKTVKVEPSEASGCTIFGDKIFIATGSKPLPVPGTKWENEWLIPGEDSFKWEELPQSVLIIGGGVMGVEFACMLKAFGVDVHIVEILNQILPGEDADISKTLTRELKKDGIILHIGKKIESYDKKDGKVIVKVSDEPELSVDKILICAGRKAITENMGIEKVGIELDKHENIKTDSHNKTNVDNIYAFGDVSGPPLLAHAASYEGKIAVIHAYTGKGENDLHAVPSGIFTIPEIGKVGLSETKCQEIGIQYKMGMSQMRMVGRSHAECETTGFAKIITDLNGKIIGATVMGKEAGEIVQVIALAMSLGITAKEFEAKMIFTHPTLSEVIWEALKEINNPL